MLGTTSGGPSFDAVEGWEIPERLESLSFRSDVEPASRIPEKMTMGIAKGLS